MVKNTYDYWNKRTPYTWGSYKDMRELRYKLQDYMLDTFRFQDFKGKKVLEIGCGSGIDSAEFIKNGADVYATDMTESAVKHTKNLFKKLNFNEEVISNVRKVDARNLPFEDNFFDHIYTYGVLHHIPDVKDAVSEIYRVLNPKGSCHVMLYHKNSLLYYYSILYLGGIKHKGFDEGLNEEQLTAKYSEAKENCPYTKVYTREDSYMLFKEAGFENIEVSIKYNVIDTDKIRKIKVDNMPNELGWHIIVKTLKT